MTDFFESLAARARGEGRAVRPRLPGLFEPRSHEHSDLTAFSEIIESSLAPAAAPAPIASPQPQIQPRRKAPEQSVQVTARAEELAPTPKALATVVADLETAHAPPGPVRTSASRPPAPPNVQRRPQDAALIQAATLPPSRDDPPQAPTIRPAVPRPSRDDPPQATTIRPAPPPRTIDPDTRRILPAAEAVAPSSALAPQPPRSSVGDVLPQVTPARPRHPPLPPPLPQQETTIHVSIGRVEVRAVQPAQEAKPREPAKSAVMSLDEYLRSRRERR